tara:strand:- start:337 stop:531 length:195 start_codon:yes stop_codon:yes gene_type:complete
MQIIKQIAIFSIFFGLSGNVYAYLDMGTGSYVIQAILAGVFTSIYFIKLYWLKLTHFFSKIFKK